jgi:hypothetical protein
MTKFDINPPYRLELRQDGSVWVEGDGILVPVDSILEGQQLISRLITEDPSEVIREYLKESEDHSCR